MKAERRWKEKKRMLCGTKPSGKRGALLYDLHSNGSCEEAYYCTYTEYLYVHMDTGIWGSGASIFLLQEMYDLMTSEAPIPNIC